MKSCLKRKNFFVVLMCAAVLGVAGEAANAGLWVDPNIFDVNIIEGCTLTQNLTVGNDGGEDLDFMIRTRQVGNSGDLVGIDGMSTETAGSGTFSIPADHDFTVVSDANYVPGKLIVRFAAGADGKIQSAAEKSQILSSLGGATIKRNFKIVPGLSVVKLPAGMTVEQALPVFNKASGILYAEPDYKVQICSTIPDDTRFDDLWGMHNTGQTGGTADADIDAPEAWDIGTGSSEIIVAVIDTGVDYTHIDLAANMWVNEAEYNGTPGQDDDGNGYVDDIYGYDFRNNDGDPMDDHYHGTHCAGTVGAVGNNGEGVAGVCWNVRIMAVKFLSSGGSGTTADAISSVEYSTLMGANLSSNSWGGGGYSQGLKDAINAAGAAGMLFVAAAGNDNENTDVYPHYPSSYDCESLISVMSTDKYDNKSGFSNWGPTSVDLGAPGSDILSCKLGGGYKYASGTSMATPHVVGACALLWSMNQMLSNSEVKDILLQTVDETLPGLCVSQGRLNVYSAILETRAPWIEIDHEEGTVGPGDSNDVSVIFDALELAPGIYEAEIVVISNDPCSPTIIPVTMTVNPDDLVVTPIEDFESSGTRGGPFTPQCMTYTLTNNGSAPVSWTTDETENWVEVEPNEGVLDPNNSIDVDVCITSDANLLDPNIYDQVLIFENTDSGSIKLRLVTLTVKPPDCFTESFDDSANDLDGLMLTFTPDGSGAYYEACREKANGFPTDPNGGIDVSLGDDDFAEVFLGGQGPGKRVLFYGQSYNRFYIGSNGYITFGQGDTEFSGTLGNHFDMPRISALFTDLTPADSQNISWKRLGDRVAVTFEDVPLYGDKTAKNSFQIEMFYVDGTIRITWLDIAAASGVAGLSEGYGLPPFFLESNLSEYVPCWPYCDFNRDYLVNFTDFAMFAMHWLEEGCEVPYWCGKADLDFSGMVETADVGIFAEDWLMKVDWFLQPISHWKFDETSGTTAYDSAGDNHGTVYGATWTTGQIDGALNFDGADDYVDVGDKSSLEPNSFTIAAWIKPGNASSTQHIAGKLGNEPVDNCGYGYRLEMRNDKASLLVDPWGCGNGNPLESTTSLQLGQWYFVTGTYDGSTAEIYLNGEPENSGARTLNAYYTNFYIGACYSDYHNAFYDHFNGKIDDVRIYDRALTSEEIWQLYQGGVGPKASNPNPADGATGVDPNTVLSWSPGKDAASHDVYLGTDYNDVNDATPDSNEYMGNFDVNNYDPNGLDLLTTYYWRIDEVSTSTTYKGDIWSFTTWLEPGFVSWWKFDEGSGTTAYDSAGNNDGTIYGATWTTGQIDGALSFDGDGDYVSLPDLDFGSTLTISVWLYNEDATAYRQGIVTQGTNSNNFVSLGTGSTNQVVFFIKNSGTQNAAAESIALEQNKWIHYVGVLNSTDILLYKNGVLNNSATQTVNPPIMTGDTRIAHDDGIWGSGDKYFSGTIDDVRIYNRALSAEEIWQLYQNGLNSQNQYFLGLN